MTPKISVPIHSLKKGDRFYQGGEWRTLIEIKKMASLTAVLYTNDWSKNTCFRIINDKTSVEVPAKVA